MNKLRLIGWSFIPLGIFAAAIGFVYQESVGGVMKSRETQSAGGAFLACIGWAGLLLTVDSARSGVIKEEDREVTRKDRPKEFWWNVGIGAVLWTLFLVAGLYQIISVWIK